MEPDYVKVYGEGMWRVCTLTVPQQKLIIALLRRATSADCGMRVTVNAMIKLNLCQDLETNSARLNQTLKELEEIGMIRLKTRNLYEVNPHMFGKGEWQFIKKLRQTWPPCLEE